MIEKNESAERCGSQVIVKRFSAPLENFLLTPIMVCQWRSHKIVRPFIVLHSVAELK